MTMLAKVSAGLPAALSSSVASAQDLPVIKGATLEIGALNWELQTIIQNGLDEANGFRLEAQGYADNAATRIALEGDEADIAVADWICVARQRADGKDYVSIPYSAAVGAWSCGRIAARRRSRISRAARSGSPAVRSTSSG